MSDLFADVSSYQPKDLTYIKDLGAKAVIVKATEGTYYRNPNAPAQVKSGLDLGMQVHLYHYGRFTTAQQAINEAEYFSNFAKSLGFRGDCIMVADIEEPKMAGSDIYHNTITFLERLKALGWPKVALYSMASWWQNGNLPKNYPMWVANYGISQPGINNAVAWQFTSTYNGLSLDMSYDFTGLFTKGGQATQELKPVVNPDDVVTVTTDMANAFTDGGDIVPGSPERLTKGSRWQSLGISYIAGEPQYSIGDNWYLPQKYTDQANICTVRGPKDYGFASVNGEGTGWRFSEYYFKGQSHWKVLGTKLINDKLYYQVSDQDYVDADVTYGSAK